MTPYFEQDGITLYHGDCREVMAGLPDQFVHAIVTDPPYGLAFMGKRWDYDVPSVEIWQECLRVLKPGGHLLAFAGTRTQHRMAVRIEDAGFEIRDMIVWVYGSGFPKSMDVSKAIDKAAGAERARLAPQSRKRPSNAIATSGFGQDGWSPQDKNPATDAARRWNGWGTALKPALEPITVARKPLRGTVAENILTHGCGGLNVDACRVGTESTIRTQRDSVSLAGWASVNRSPVGGSESGRWPANLIHDGSDEVTGLFPETAPAKQADRGKGKGETGCYGVYGGDPGIRGHNDAGGSAARFFYTAKADKSDRGPGNNHPTVKPVDLMRYLVRLVCPMDGVVLDPFAGSGTTLQAAQAEGCRAIGVEREASYCEIITGRFHQRRLF